MRRAIDGGREDQGVPRERDSGEIEGRKPRDRPKKVRAQLPVKVVAPSLN